MTLRRCRIVDVDLRDGSKQFHAPLTPFIFVTVEYVLVLDLLVVDESSLPTACDLLGEFVRQSSLLILQALRGRCVLIQQLLHLLKTHLDCLQTQTETERTCLQQQTKNYNKVWVLR